MAKDPSMPFYVNDWLSSSTVTCMTLAERGAYVQLLCHCWASGDASLPDDDRKLAALSQMGSDWKDSAPTIRAALAVHPEKPGFLTNQKVYELWRERQEWREKCSIGGQNSAKTRKGSTKGSSTTLARPLEVNSQVNGNSSSSSSSLSSSSSESSSSNHESPPPPSGERRRETFDPMGIDFPDTMQTDGFPEAWARWVAYRKEITPRLKPKSWQAQAAQFIRYGPQAGVMAIDKSIASGWRGVFPDKCCVERQLGFRGTPLESKADIRRREEAEARRKLEEWAREGES